VARVRLGISFTGNVIAAPFASLIRNACSLGRYTTVLARGSVFAARLPAREARAKFERRSFSTQLGIRRDLRMEPNAWVTTWEKSVPNLREEGKQVQGVAQVLILNGGRYWDRTSGPCRVKRG